MRFQRRIRIFKGLTLNLSKSGVGFSVGPRGLKYSVGPRGTYLSAGIPGTGLSQRTKLSSPSFTSSQETSGPSDMTVRIRANDDGSIGILYEDGSPIVNESLLRKIKRTDWYKDGAHTLSSRLQAEVQSETSRFIKIHAQSPAVYSADHWEEVLKSLTLETYTTLPFTEPEPSIESARRQLEYDALGKFKSVLFWKNGPNRRAYVEAHLQATFAAALDDWNRKTQAHEKKELEHKIEFDSAHKQRFAKDSEELKLAIAGDHEYVEKQIESILNDIELPAQFSVDYRWDVPGLHLDLDLPEIEDLPQRKADMLASGRVSVKAKSQKELRRDYVECVTGIGFFFSATFFNVSPAIDRIVLSAYTQRTSAKTGHIEDQYVYSVAFTREKFREVNLTKVVPFVSLTNFEHRIEMSANFELGTIVPLTA